MSQNNRLLLLLTYIPFFLVLLIAFLNEVWTAHQEETARNNPNRGYSAQQILRWSEAMGPVLAPDAAELQFLTSSLLAQDRTGKRVRWKWQVAISDTEGNIQSTLLWDANRGEVEQASCPLRDTPRFSGKMTRAEAVAVSRRWLATLRMTEKETWELEGTPKYWRGQWQCRFLIPDTSAYVAVDAGSGHLLFARTRPRLLSRPPLW